MAMSLLCKTDGRSTLVNVAMHAISAIWRTYVASERPEGNGTFMHDWFAAIER